MILTAGLTPAWQQVMVFQHFRYGEVNRASEVTWLAQGKVINAGIGAHFLGGPSLTLSPLGGPPMAQIDRELEALGVPRRWVVTEASTRVCTTLLDQTTGVMTELVENGRPLKPEELDAFLRAYAEEAAKADVAILTGSLPIGTPNSFYRELVDRSPCPVVLDFRGEGLLGTLAAKPLIVKPNREELVQTVGHPIDNDEQLLAAMRSLNQRGAQWVVITQGGGPIWVTSATQTYKILPLLAKKVVNPIGCGDAMAAGIAWAIREGRTVIEAVRVGIAAATDNIQRLETCRLDHQWVGQHAQQVQVEDFGHGN
jgi:1-phosphofructokinase family hexose kinase